MFDSIYHVTKTTMKIRFLPYIPNIVMAVIIYGKCSKISNTLKLRTPKIIDKNNF